jgi:hypothetical protein
MSTKKVNSPVLVIGSTLSHYKIVEKIGKAAVEVG